MNKQLLFSVTSKDFEMQTFCTGGKGGQKQNSTNSGVRLIHIPSGARGEGREERHQSANKKRAFLRLIETQIFKNWHRVEVARRMGQRIEETPEQIMVRIDRMVDEALKDGTIKIEYLENGGV